jgi:hypothetical protein
MDEPSLLDWLESQLGQPRVQRLVRFGLAGVAAVLGFTRLLSAGGQEAGGALLVGLSALLVVWGLGVRAPAQPAAGSGGGAPMPGLSLGVRPSERLAPSDPAARREATRRLLARLRLPGAVFLALLAQALLSSGPRSVTMALVLYALALLMFVGTVLYDRLLGAPPAEVAPAATARLAFRWVPLAVAMAAGVITFASAGGNTFRPIGVLAWIIAIGAWLAATWEVDTAPSEWWAQTRARVAAAFEREGLVLRLARWSVLVLAVLAVGAYFRFAQLDPIPPEMTSDHVEKLFDVKDVLDGQRPIFFERNTGREPLQFYFAALVAEWLGTGLSHLTLKITGAVAGFLLLPYVYLLGREIQDRRLGLLAMLLTAISLWATAISRVGLRFPLTPLFVAPVLYYLLRGFRSGRRNDFLLAGLLQGVGLYGYSTIRVLPLLLVLAILWLALPLRRAAQNAFQSAAGLRLLLANSVLLFATTAIVFLPLYRYAVEPGSYFWQRAISRLGETEAPVEGAVLQIFLQNNWNALRMFNYRGDQVWVNTVPVVPTLDQVTGALFILGAAFLLLRLVLRRDQIAGFLLLALPVLLLPSTLSFAFPEENPSVVRTAGAIPIVMLMAAYPLWLLFNRLQALWTDGTGRRIGLAAVGALVGVAALLNYALYFQRYPQQYIGSAQNASEIGAVARAYANSVGSLEQVYMCLHPHWADTRAVGIYAGQVGWEQVLPAAEFNRLAGDPRGLLIIVNPRSTECVASLRTVFPDGVFEAHHSARGQQHDFLKFLVPGTQAVEDEALLVAP